MSLPRIILSCESNFLVFAKTVCKAWRNLYPEIKITVCYVGEERDISFLTKENVDVVTLPLLDYPTPNLAKLARFYVASTYDEIVMVEDIDTAPLQTDFLNRIFSEIDHERILAVGHEVYENICPGKFPVSNISGIGGLFKELLNPKNLDWPEWVKSLADMPKYDGKENPNNHPNNFSDESLIRSAINKIGFGNKLKKIRRDVDIYNYWIDRSWWKVDKDRLVSGDYVIVNFIRPCIENFHVMKDVFDFILQKDSSVEDLF